VEGSRQGSVRKPEKFEGSSPSQNSAGVGLPQSALETEDSLPES